MKKLLFILLCLPFILVAQTNNNDILLKSGKISLENKFNLSPEIIEIIHGDYYRFIQFSEIPSEEQKDILVEDGIEFLEYIPFNTYVVSISTNFSNIEKLRDFGAISLQRILPNHKIDPKIQNKEYPEWALKNGKLSIKVLLYKNADLTNFKAKNSKYKIISENKIGNSIVLEINPNDLIKVATINSVWYIEPIDPPSVKENKTGRTLHRSNTINTNYASGRHYNGEGINIMMQDDGIIGPHIDYQGRIDQSNCGGCSTSNSNDHGDHVAGTIMGSGNLDPVAAGMSNAAFLYVYSSSNNNYYDVPAIYQNNDVIITSKSYSNGCNAGYTSLARDLDEQINLYPSLIHVFSAGNSGNSDCGYGAGSNWGNVTGGHKQAKNVLAVANLSLTGSLSSSSSRGPAADGRIKPDIGAKGSSVNSTIPANDYGLKTGTSMACPGIAGVMAQLYQAYKDLNTGQNPNSALMKCILLNSADDIGNSGPDFKHGWGEVNAYRAVKILENNQYFTSEASQSGNNSHNITVPSGTKKIKVMVYWHDKEASANSSIALVNDINISLTSPTSLTYNPWVLDYAPNATNLDQAATRGIDDRNNMEQVTITNPSSGSYTLNINGFAIPYGPQEYWVTYEFITDDIQLTYPIGGEGLVPGESEYIRWDAHDISGNFTLEYSINSGTNWNTISTSVSGNTRHYIWTVPNNITANALVRVSRNGYTDQSDATFTIINVPQNVSVNWLCPDSIYVSWSSVSGATSYEVSMLGQKYMDSMTTTNNLTALIVNPNPLITDSWFSVCAKVNNGNGRRAVAVNAQPLNPGCVGYGCTDPNAYNYDPTAIYDNGTCIYCNTNLPYSENFDNGIGSWTNTGSAGNWTLNSGGTPSTSTGPTDDVTGGGNYMYIEASSPNYPNVGPFILTSECFDLNNTINPTLSFYYNMYGAAMGTLNVYANGSLIWSLSGDQGQGWNLVQIPLTSVGNALIIDFEGTTGTSYTSDIAIDDINIIGIQQVSGCTDPIACNYNPLAIVDDGSCLTIYGCTDSTACFYNPLAQCDDGSCSGSPGCTNPAACNYDPNALCDDGSCSGSPGCTSPAACNYDPNALCDDGSCYGLLGCTDPTALNYDSLASCDNGTCLYCNTTLPYAENFDINIGTWTNTGSAGSWLLNSGATLSTGTGPSDDVTGGGNYMYIEASAPNYPNIGPFTLTSECFDLTGSTNPTLSFYYNMYGSGMGTLNVYANGNLIWSLSGDQEVGWNLAEIPLVSLGNNIIIDFEGVTGTSFTSDIAIDNINIEDQQSFGCLDSSAINYDPNAAVDDGSCIYCSDINLAAVVINESIAGANDGSIDLTVTGVGVCITEDSLSCPLLGGNGQSGNAFNLINTSGYPLEITGFSQGPSSGNNSAMNVQMEVYMFPGDYTSNMNSSGWAIVGTALVDLTANAATGYIPVNGVVIPAGATYGFWVGRTSGTQQYTNGVGTAGVTTWQSDANITITEGHGGIYPLGFGFSPRCWNGIIHYGDDVNLYTYSWSNGATSEDISNLSLGSYSVTVTDCIGCSESGTWNVLNNSVYGCTDSLALNFNPLATVDDGSCLYCDVSISQLFIVQNSSPFSCDGWIYTVGNSSNTPITYLWSNGTTQNNIMGLCAGTYTLILTDSVGCTIDTMAIIGTPLVDGCTDPLACNYDALATNDDGSCEYTSCVGCTSSPITGLFISDIIDDRVTANFDNMNTYDINGTQVCRVDQIRIRYREVGTSAWGQKNIASPTGYDAITGICNSTQKTDKNIYNLTSSTTYQWEVKTWYCDAGATGWVVGPNFTTAGECPNIGNLAAVGANPNKATFTWDDSNGSYEFVRIKMRVDSISSPVLSDWFNVGGNGVTYPTFTKDKNGLVAGETYRGQGRTWCDPNGGAYNSLSWTPLVTWTQPTSNRLKGGESITNLDIFPNPSRDVFNISFTSEDIQDLRVKVLNVVGEILIDEDLQQFIGEYTKQIDLTTNAKGIYFLEIEAGDAVINKKLILQ